MERMIAVEGFAHTEQREYVRGADFSAAIKEMVRNNIIPRPPLHFTTAADDPPKP